MKVTDLPSDVRLIILSYLDLPSLARAVQLHSAFNSVWASYPEHLSRAISIRSGLVDSKTVGAGAPLEPRSWRHTSREEEEGGRDLDAESSARELRRVIEGQRSTSGAFDGVTDWKSYAKTRWKIDQNWKYGRCEQHLIKLDLVTSRLREMVGAVDDGFWRFKIDPVSGWIIVTGRTHGGLWAFDNEGELKWWSQVPIGPYPHVELTYHGSTSYICSALGRDALVVYYYYDPAIAVDSPPNIHIRADILSVLEDSVVTLDPGGRGYRPLALVDFGQVFTASKLRYPYVLVATADSNLVLGRDFTDSLRGHTYRASIEWIFRDERDAPGTFGEGEVTYLELDDDLFFVSGLRSVNIWRFSRGDLTSTALEHQVWPPRAPPGHRNLQPLVHRPLYSAGERDGIRPWTAVHHDSKSRFLVGASYFVYGDASFLTVTYRYKEAIFSTDCEEIEQRTMTLRLDRVSSICQLSVENDRAIFVTSSLIGYALFVVPLYPFESLSDFVANPPKPVCLAFPLPVADEPSRIESTSTDIYVPVCVPLISPELEGRYPASVQSFKRLRSGWEAIKPEFPFPFAMSWQTLEGETLVDYESESVPKDVRARELDAHGKDFDRYIQWEGLVDQVGATGLMRFSFAGST